MRACLLFDKGPLPTLEATQTALAEEALKRTNGNQGRAARMLGITIPTLMKYAYRDMEDEGLGSAEVFSIPKSRLPDRSAERYEIELTMARLERMRRSA